MGVVHTLTSGNPVVGSFLSSKTVKDFVLDVLLALPGALLAINVGSVQEAVAASTAVAFVVTDTVIRALYRVTLRWAQTP